MNKAKLNKETIRAKVEAKIQLLQISANNAAKIIGISGATLNNVLNQTWKAKPELTPSEEMWRRLAVWAGVLTEWKTAHTSDFKKITGICRHAQEMTISKAISFSPGTGKTWALREYANNNPAVYYIECEEYWNKKIFLQKLCSVMGINNAMLNVAEMVEEIIDFLNSKDKPLVIIDEADKLKDPVINLYKTFYNKTLSGFILCGAPYFKNRIEKGCRLQKQTYQEIYSRIGGEFLRLKGVSDTDIRMICEVNGIEEPMHMEQVKNYANGDLRRAKSVIERIKLEISVTLKAAV